MSMVTPSRRVRRTPFTDGVTAAGVKGYTVYNRMLLPTHFGDMAEECAHLKTDVQVWDVSVERQVAIKGPDARKLMQILTPRDLSTLNPAKAMYVPVTDQDGYMLNDPVLLNPEPDLFWLSIADSEYLLWAKAVAASNDFQVEVFEPDVSPLAIQGPKAFDLAAKVFGEHVRELRFFGVGRVEFRGHEFVISRSGWSKQGGFEIYMDDFDLGMPLWNALFEAGQEFNVKAGCPNLIERVEGGLLSYGNDMTIENTPLECGLGKYVSPEACKTCFGGQALLEEIEAGSKQMVRPIAIMGDIPVCDRLWDVYADGQPIGQITSAVWSPDFQTNVAIGMVANSHWDAGTKLQVETQDGHREAVVAEKFWI